MAVIVENVSEKRSKKSVTFTGDSAIQAGYVFCYNRDSTTGDSAGASDLSRAWEVEKPTSANLANYAGVAVKGHSAVSGGQKIEIYEHRAAGSIATVWSKANNVINVTRIGPVAGQWYMSESSPNKVATANQTVDRSNAAGVCQAVLDGVNEKVAVEVVTAASRTTVQLPTAAIWDNFDIKELRANPFAGSLWESDFTRPFGVMSTGQTAVNSGDIYGDAATEMIRSAPGAGIGEIILTAGAAGKEIALRPSCPITVSAAAGAAGRPWAWEVRVKIGTITNGDIAGMIIGLIDADYLMAGDELVDTTGAIIDKGFVGVNSLASTEADLIRSFKNESQTIDISSAIKTMTAGTYFTVGMYYNGTLITCFVDGVANTTGDITNAEIVEATPTFPQAEELGPILAFKETAAESNTVTFDWVRFAQHAA